MELFVKGQLKCLQFDSGKILKKISILQAREEYLENRIISYDR